MSTEIARREVERQLLSDGKYDLYQIEKALNTTAEFAYEDMKTEYQRLVERSAETKQRKPTKAEVLTLHIQVIKKHALRELELTEEVEPLPIPLSRGSVTIGRQPGIKLPPSVGTAPPPTTGSGASFHNMDLMRHRTFDLSSAGRDFATDTNPNDFTYNFTDRDRPTGYWRVEILDVYMRAAHVFYSRPTGYDFYIEITGVPKEHTIQNDGLSTVAQFKARAYADTDSHITIQIINSDVVLEKESSTFESIHVRLLDESKQPLDLNQDIYRILSTTQTTSPNQTVFTIADSTTSPHSVQSGDSVRLRGIEADGDLNHFADTNKFKAIVISTTEVAIDQFKTGVTYTTVLPRLIVPQNSIRLTVRFYFRDTPLSN